MAHHRKAALLLGTVLTLNVASGWAQTAPAADAPQPSETDVLALDAIVVTAVSSATSKLNSSVSVSAVLADDIAISAPRSAAEIFRNIPGIRSESTGGEGNANIAVRGLPVASGGAKFLQLHEDGLPVLEFGDIAFGNADIFLRADRSVARIEAVRGGSASTFASNSPGGVINFISNTGESAGGLVGLGVGLDYGEYRLDAAYGGPIGENWQFHIGGFYRQGEGPREAGYTANKGGQIKGNVTRTFENGFIRLSFKYLNDRTIGYLPMPMQVTGSNADPDWSSIPGFSARHDTPHSALFQTDVGLDGNNNRRTTDIADGMRPLVKQVGLEFSFDVADGWTIANRFKYADTSGRFVSPFPAEVATLQSLANSVGGSLTGNAANTSYSLRYANGPRAGQAVPASANGNGLGMRVHLFNTELNDLSNMANDLKVSRQFDAGTGRVTVAAGVYKAHQTIDMDWLWNSYLMEVNGNNAALLDVVGTSGGVSTVLTQNGLTAYGVPFWGNCCQRSYDTRYNITTPYASLGFETDRFNVDVSLRWDNGKATGSYAANVQAANVDVNGDGIIQPTERSVSTINNAAPAPVDYNWDYVSYSVGANYRFTDDLAAFARWSRGGRANADRLLFGTVRPDGSVRPEDAVDFVRQIEAGVKYRTGGLGLFVTLFDARTQEQNFEATSQRFLDRTYTARGVEVEAAYRIGGFALNAGLTWTDAEISRDAITPANEGNRPRRQATLVYQLTPSYTLGGFSIGANAIGTTKAYAQDDNQLVMPGFTQINAFAAYELDNGIRLGLNANNLFNAFGVTESEEGAIAAGATNYVRARTINGRTVTLSLQYAF